MKCKICGKSYKCNKCAYDKHVDNHKMEPFKIRKFNDFGDQMREIENKNNQRKHYYSADHTTACAPTPLWSHKREK